MKQEWLFNKQGLPRAAARTCMHLVPRCVALMMASSSSPREPCAARQKGSVRSQASMNLPPSLTV